MTSKDQESPPKISFPDHDGNNDEDDDEPIADREKTIKKESFIRLNNKQQKEVAEHWHLLNLPTSFTTLVSAPTTCQF